MYILNRSNLFDLKALIFYIDIDFTQLIKIAYKAWIMILAYCFILISSSID